MNKKPTWVIFDVGNVLYDFIGFAKDMARFFGLAEEAMLHQIKINTPNTMQGELSDYEWWENILKALNLKDKMEEFFKHWENDLKYWLQDTKQLMSELDKNGYKIAILTNNWVNQSEDLKKNLSSHADIKFYFESSVLKMRKPEKRLYEYVQNTIKARGNEIFFIDDIDEYIEGAKNLGWQTFLYSVGNDGGKTDNDQIRKILL